MESLLVPVVEATQVAAARRAALGIALSLGLEEPAVGRLGILVTEAATNLLKHAKDGACLFRPLARSRADGSTARGVEMLVLDRGPGMADVAACMRDGFSTAGSMGTGLGAMRRLASRFDVHSVPGVGTGFVAELWARDAGAPDGRADVGAVSVPLRGEPVCGDGFDVRLEAARTTILVVDGIGHGQAAADASHAAIASFRRDLRGEVETQVENLHRALRGTRGAAAAIVQVDHEKNAVRYCGVGNIAGTLYHPDRTERMVSHTGTLGHGARRIKPFAYAWTPVTTMVLNSDGLSTRWNLDRYPTLLAHHPSLIAGVLFRDWARAEDDATVVVLRGGP